MRASLISILVVALMTSSSCFAEELGGTQKCAMPLDSEGKPACLCVIPNRLLQKTPVALLSYISGNVLKSGDSGFTPVPGPSTTLKVGDTVLLQADAGAVLTARNCSHAVGPQETLVIKQIDGPCACAALIEENPAPPPPQSADAGAGTLMALGAAAGVGVGVLLLASPSPASP